MGREVVFVTLSTDQRTSSYTQSTALSFSGEPGEVKDLLRRCLVALEDLIGDGEQQ